MASNNKRPPIRQNSPNRVSRIVRGRLREKRSGTGIPMFFRIVASTIIALSLVTLFGTTVSAVGSAIAVSQFLKDLPSPNNIGNRDVFKSTKIYDRNGVLLYELYDEQSGRRTPVKLSDLPPHVKWATLATEDADFYNNPGFDPRGIARAAYQEFTGARQSGGSTITQQLIKNVLFDENEWLYDRSYTRKAKEIALAYQLSQQYTKDQIFEMYLNEINYGNLNYGIEAASEGYFGKSIKDVSIAEAAMLAGIPALPATYNPLTNPIIAKSRQRDVLDLMVHHGFIDQETAEKAYAEELVYRQPRFDIKAPHFVFYVRDLLEEKFGGPRLYRGGFSVYTTLDYRMQQMAEEVVKKNIADVRKYNASNAALVALDPRTGQILAMVGSADYFDQSIDGQVNVALSERQPGSSIKPITYAAAFAKGWTPGTMILDAPFSQKDGTGKIWSPQNYDNAFHGWMTARDALGNSWNIPAVKALEFVGVDTMIEWARKMGITTFKDPKRYGLALTLGGGEVKLLEHAGAYSVFANAGVKNPPTPFLKILDDEGNVVEEWQDHSERVMSPELAYLITDILADPQARRVTYGLGPPMRLVRPAAAKTGTTDDHRDGWTMGYTSYLVTGVWVGNSNNTPMAGLYGSRSATPIWHDFMEAAFSLYPVDEPFVRPPGIAEGTVCPPADPATGQSGGCRKDIYIKGFGPNDGPKARFTYRTVLISKVDGKLANETCPADQVEKVTFAIPIDPKNLTEEEKALPKPPTENSSCVKATPTPTGGITNTITSTIGSPVVSGTPITARTGVSIGSPGSGTTVRGNVAIGGTASVPDFASFRVDVSPGIGGAQYTTLAEGGTPVDLGYLATFPTTRFANGTYTILLTVFDKAGRRSSSQITVTVAN